MNIETQSGPSMLWPTALAGVLGAVVLGFAVLAGPADADTSGAKVDLAVFVQR